jgi:DNA-binding transcriptional LysR family regulator
MSVMIMGEEQAVELRTFRYFVAIADAGSVNAAAHALHLTQPSLARQLRRLERRLGLPLLELQGGRTVLTETGHRFLPHARELLSAAEATFAVATGLAGELAVPVRVPEPVG